MNIEENHTPFGVVNRIPEDGVKVEYLYMPEISMFDSHVVAEFELDNGKLDSVSAQFFPNTLDKASNVANDIVVQLEKTHKFLEKEPNPKIPGAYHMTFIGEGARIKLSINLTKTSEPRIDFYAFKNITENEKQNELDRIKARNEAAFGAKN